MSEEKERLDNIDDWRQKFEEKIDNKFAELGQKTTDIQDGNEAILNEMAKIEMIIEIYDNGHEHEFDPKDFMVIRKEEQPYESSEFNKGYYKGLKEMEESIKRKSILLRDCRKKNQELIAEFLRDWHWYLALEWHLEKMNDCFPQCKKCRCNFTDFENQFEEKWQKKRDSRE